VTGANRRSLVGRPYRRLRRWARHTPNGDIALTMMAIGIALIFVAVVVWLLA
jgi:high-affinity K+ transport system ATPase subunit B